MGGNIDGVIRRKKPCSNCYSVRKFISGLENQGVIKDGFAYLLVVNTKNPCKSYLLKEPIS